jgi:Fe-S cluster assembly iron-binding protein IscA
MKPILQGIFLFENRGFCINFDNPINKIVLCEKLSEFELKPKYETFAPIRALKSKGFLTRNPKNFYIIEEMFYLSDNLHFTQDFNKNMVKHQYSFKEKTLFILLGDNYDITKDFISFDFLHNINQSMKTKNSKNKRCREKRNKVYIHRDDFFMLNEFDLDKVIKDIKEGTFNIDNPNLLKRILVDIVKNKV